MEVIVHYSEVPNNGRQLRLGTEVIDDEGNSKNILHIMPVDAVEWRMAQFNVTADQALDILVAEPYMKNADPDELDLLPTRSQARTRVLKRKDDAVSRITYKAGPLPEGMAPLPSSIADSGEGDPKALLLEQSVVDDTEIVLKRAVMDVQRELVRERAATPKQKLPRTVRRAPAAINLAEAPLEPTTIVEQPSPLAERLIASRLEQIRTRRDGAKP